MIPKTLGERIIIGRKKQGIRQNQLANTIGISSTALNYYEKNKRKPSLDTIILLAEALDVSVNYLMGVEPINAVDFYEAMKCGVKRSISEQQYDSFFQPMSGVEERGLFRNRP